MERLNITKSGELAADPDGEVVRASEADAELGELQETINGLRHRIETLQADLEQQAEDYRKRIATLEDNLEKAGESNRQIHHELAEARRDAETAAAEQARLEGTLREIRNLCRWHAPDDTDARLDSAREKLQAAARDLGGL